MKKPSYYKYKNEKPVIGEILEHSKLGVHIRLFVWETRAQMQRHVVNKRTKSPTMVQACFLAKYEERGAWLGDVHFHKEQIGMEDVAHECIHVASKYLRTRGKWLNGRNEEDFAYLAGGLTAVIVSKLTAAGITLVA